MGRRLAVGVGVATGTALLVVGVASAGLVGLLSGTPGAAGAGAPALAAAPTPRAAPTAGPTTAAPTALGADVELAADIVLAETYLDPAALPLRTVETAALVAVAGVATSPETMLLAVDATTGAWVRVDAPGPWYPVPLALSPDGRALLRSRAEPLEPVGIDVVQLGTGVVRELPMPVPPGRHPDDCWHRDVTWAPLGGRVGVVTGCAVDVPGQEWPQDVGMETWVHEVDVATGAARVIEHVPNSGPSETYPAYSPDGRFLAYGIGYAPEDDDDQGWATLRVIAVDGSSAHEAHALHMVYGDPWLDDTTLVVWDELSAAEDAYLLVDAPSGTSEPLGLERLLDLAGFVGGRLVIARTPWVEEPIPCPGLLCTADTTTGAVRPWITMPEGAGIAFIAPARAVIEP